MKEAQCLAAELGSPLGLGPNFPPGLKHSQAFKTDRSPSPFRDEGNHLCLVVVTTVTCSPWGVGRTFLATATQIQILPYFLAVQTWAHSSMSLSLMLLRSLRDVTEIMITADMFESGSSAAPMGAGFLRTVTDPGQLRGCPLTLTWAQGLFAEIEEKEQMNE